MKYTEKELAGFRREQTDLETKRAELKKKIANHRAAATDVSEDDLNEIEKEIRGLNQRATELGEILKDSENPEKRGNIMKINGKEITNDNYRNSPEYRDAFYRSLASRNIAEGDRDIMDCGKRAVTDFNGGSVTSGGAYLVPTTTIDKIASVLAEYGKLYSAVTKYNFNGDVSLPIGSVGEPTVNEDGTVKLNFSFTEVKIGQEAQIATVEVKNLLLKNSIPALEMFIAEQLGKWLAIQLDTNVLYGDAGSFVGILTKLTAKSYSAVDWALICTIIGSLKGGYSRRGAFVMNTQTFWQKFMSITEGSAGTPLAQNTPIIHFENGKWFILDKEVIETDAMGEGDFLFGAVKDNYITNESQEIVIEADPSPKFGEDKTLWRGKVYSGGAPVLEDEAFTFYALATDKVATPTANPAAGAVASGTAIALACATTKATIYYTLDGSTPTEDSTKYVATAKPTLTEATTIKAIAVKAGMVNSDVLTAAYTIS